MIYVVCHEEYRYEEFHPIFHYSFTIIEHRTCTQKTYIFKELRSREAVKHYRYVVIYDLDCINSGSRYEEDSALFRTTINISLVLCSNKKRFHQNCLSICC